MPSSTSSQLQLVISDQSTNTKAFNVLNGCGSLLTHVPHVLTYNEVISNTTENYYECHVTTLIDSNVGTPEANMT
jgi:hypothetical protein